MKMEKAHLFLYYNDSDIDIVKTVSSTKEDIREHGIPL